MKKNYTLALDFGNTLVKAGIFNGNKLVHSFAGTNISAEVLNKLLRKYALAGAIVSSVTNKSSSAAMYLTTHVPVVLLTDKTRVPVTNRYTTKGTLGKDRLAASVGASAMQPGKNVLVIICGTCITYDLVNAKGEYLGGAISPGLDMRLKAMNTFTAKLPLIKKKPVKSLVGNSTETSMLNGAITGAILEVDGFINHYKKQFQGLKVVISGGDADYFASKLKNKIFAVPNIVLIGLNQILLFNDQQKS